MGRIQGNQSWLQAWAKLAAAEGKGSLGVGKNTRATSLLPILSMPGLRRAKLGPAAAAGEGMGGSRTGAALRGLHGCTPGSSCPLCQTLPACRGAKTDFYTHL